MRTLVPVFLRWFALIRRRSPNTIRAYDANLRAFLTFAADTGLADPAAVKVQHVEFFLGLLLERDGCQPGTVNHHLHALRSFFRWLEREELVPRNPAGQAYLLKTPKRIPRHLTVTQQDQLLSTLALEHSPAGVRDYGLHAMLTLAGLRCAEIANLRLTDVDLDGDLRVIGKGDKERPVPVAPVLAGILRHYLADARPKLLCGRTSPYLFVRVHTWGRKCEGQPLGPKAIFYIVRKTLKRVLGMERGHPHMLRHSFASRVREHGGTLQDLQEVMGHSNIATTARYAHVLSHTQRKRMVGYIEGTLPQTLPEVSPPGDIAHPDRPPTPTRGSHPIAKSGRTLHRSKGPIRLPRRPRWGAS